MNGKSRGLVRVFVKCWKKPISTVFKEDVLFSETIKSRLNEGLERNTDPEVVD